MPKKYNKKRAVIFNMWNSDWICYSFFIAYLIKLNIIKIFGNKVYMLISVSGFSFYCYICLHYLVEKGAHGCWKMKLNTFVIYVNFSLIIFF
jgi:hypothetical protein